MRGRSLSIMISAFVLTSACGSSGRRILIPDSVISNPKDERRGGKSQSPQPYVVKMSDGKRTWQIEIPAGEEWSSFSAAIPLQIEDSGLALGNVPQTEADRELIQAKKAAGEPVPTAAPGEAIEAPSYLATLAKVKALYKKRQYELALVTLVDLDRSYPDDVRILEMKGTLYSRLNRRVEAKKAWERVLILDPDNRAVARALEQLLEDAE